MATYPVINAKTGEQKEVVLSVHEWAQWKEENSDWDRDWSDPSTCPGSENWVRFMIVSKNLIQDGMMFFIEHQKCPVQK